MMPMFLEESVECTAVRSAATPPTAFGRSGGWRPRLQEWPPARVDPPGNGQAGPPATAHSTINRHIGAHAYVCGDAAVRERRLIELRP